MRDSRIQVPVRSLLIFLSFLVLLFAGQATAWADDGDEAPVVTTEAEPPQTDEPPLVQLPDLPGVVVIGRMLEEGLPEVPIDAVGSRNVFGPAWVQKTGARDLNELVQQLPAASSRPYNGGEASAPSFSMRGLPDDGLTEYINIQIDGVPASPLPYGWTAFSFLPITIERVYGIDFIRGAYSVRYSPNTVAGILNFVSQPIPDRPWFHGRATVGDFGYVSSVVSAGTRAGRLGILGTYVDRSGDGYREGGEFHQTDLNLKLRYDFTPSSWLATSLTYMHDDHQAPGGLTQAQFAQNRWGNARPENQFDGYRGLVDLVYHQDTGCDDWWEAFAYLSQTHRHLRAQRPHFGTPLTISDWKDDSYFLGVGARFERGVWIAGQEHRIYGGIRYLREWIPAWELASEPYPGGPQTPTQDAEYYTDTFSLHVDDTFEPICNVTVNLGARVEWVADTHGDDPIGGWEFDDDFFRVLPGIGVSWQFAPCWALYGNYFEGFRAPQVWGYAFTVPGASLEYEIGRTAEVGLRLRNWHGFSGEATGWRVEYDDFGVFYTGFYENLGRILATGADFIGDWDAGAASRSLRGLRLGGSITVQDSELKEGPNAGNQTPYAWEVKATWRASYERSGWLLSLGGSYVDESFSDDANTTVPNANGNIGVNPAVTLWDARLQKTLCINRCAKVILAIGATNLFDNDWYVHSRGGFFGGGLVAGPPRQGYVSAEFVVEM